MLIHTRLHHRLAECAAAGLVGVALAAAAFAGARSPSPSVVRTIALGPEASRLIVGFRASLDGSVVRSARMRRQGALHITSQARTTLIDVTALAERVQLPVARSRQLTPSMHVLLLPQTLYGADVTTALSALRGDPTVAFAEVDERRFVQALPPDDPLFVATAGATGQWYLMTPSSAPGGDASATDAISAWAISTGSSGTVIADVDSGVRFDHPDLLRAGFGGRLLPGYDFIGGDLNRASGAAVGTFLIANDGDGWDPDPSDPGDWINATDQANTAVFPAADCTTGDSSWHGTRVMGILGALTDNATGIAGMTWDPYLLPVRALGKCGGYDSDIIAGMQWAAGLPVTGVPDNPYPADIVNLSLGSSNETCPADYSAAVAALTGMGVLVVASAGNEGGSVDAPANCPGVLAVAGLRNVGTKVAYSSFGPEVGIAAPAGNCVNLSGACLRSLDTTSNTGLTVPADSTYTNQTNPNLGTSFSAPIVAGIAALMRAVNANLTPAQLILRLKASAVQFPMPTGTPVCATAISGSSSSPAECACPNDGSQCGAGMVNALGAVMAAERPIAAVAVSTAGGGIELSAAGSAAACGRTIAGYAWAASGGAAVPAGTSTSTVAVTSKGTSGSVTLTVTDSAGASDSAVLQIAGNGAVTVPASVSANAGSSAEACIAPLTVAPAAPTVTEAFSPASVGVNVASTLTITLANTNGFDLTQSALSVALPTNLAAAGNVAAGSAEPATTCTGASVSLTASASGVALSNAIIPAEGSCTITLPVTSATPGSYTTPIAANALSTGPAGSSSTAADATLEVTAPSKGGGGAFDLWDSLFVTGLLLASRRGWRVAKRRR